ncbi:MAG: hypothetical protein EKK37_17330 [Sphingobacteriales bacterium]|nr:MAG: hypothetical protein EKK37_17330 [Sphingobacteriales bacterium]
MARFDIAKEYTSDLEGGFWNDPSAGYTYAGITFKYYPDWEGWTRLIQLGKQFFGAIEKIPRYTKFNDTILDEDVNNYYQQRQWKFLSKGDSIINQTIANMIYDFIVHKENAAIRVINKAVKTKDSTVITNGSQLSHQVVLLLNQYPQDLYKAIRAARINYYKKGPFSTKVKKAFIKRVQRFPVEI